MLLQLEAISYFYSASQAQRDFRMLVNPRLLVHIFSLRASLLSVQQHDKQDKQDTVCSWPAASSSFKGIIFARQSACADHLSHNALMDLHLKINVLFFFLKQNIWIQKRRRRHTVISRGLNCNIKTTCRSTSGLKLLMIHGQFSVFP